MPKKKSSIAEFSSLCDQEKWGQLIDCKEKYTELLQYTFEILRLLETRSKGTYEQWLASLTKSEEKFIRDTYKRLSKINSHEKSVANGKKGREDFQKPRQAILQIYWNAKKSGQRTPAKFLMNELSKQRFKKLPDFSTITRWNTALNSAWKEEQISFQIFTDLFTKYRDGMIDRKYEEPRGVNFGRYLKTKFDTR